MEKIYIILRKIKWDFGNLILGNINNLTKSVLDSSKHNTNSYHKLSLCSKVIIWVSLSIVNDEVLVGYLWYTTLLFVIIVFKVSI